MIDALTVIQKLEITDTSFSDGEIEYMYIENNLYNKIALKSIGVRDRQIEEGTCDDVIDIGMFVFDFLRPYNIYYYDSQCGFLTDIQYEELIGQYE